MLKPTISAYNKKLSKLYGTMWLWCLCALYKHKDRQLRFPSKRPMCFQQRKVTCNINMRMSDTQRVYACLK